MRRGDIYVIDLEPSRPGEAGSRRPCVLVSSDQTNTITANRRRGAVTVVPLTTNVSRIYAFNVLAPAGSTGLRKDSKVQTEQIRTVSYERIGKRLGRLDPLTLGAVDEALRIHLEI